MKPSTWKFVLSLMLLALLPLQSIAAASMLACAPVPVQSQVHHLTQQDAQQDAQHRHHALHEDGTQPSHDHHGKFKCGQGGPCCPVAALTSLSFSFVAPQKNLPFITVNLTPPSAMVRTLERPPRLV